MHTIPGPVTTKRGDSCKLNLYKISSKSDGVCTKWAVESATESGRSALTSVGGPHPPLEGPNSTEKWRKRAFPIPAWAGTPIFCHPTVKFKFLGPLDSGTPQLLRPPALDWELHPRFPGFQLIDNRLWDFWAPTTISANSSDDYLIVCIYIPSWFWVSGEPQLR